MDESDWELLEGMGNCYEACGENFENTVRMVARARDLRAASVKDRLIRIRSEVGETAEYRELRARLPRDFPM